jgi:hypothetical protein
VLGVAAAFLLALSAIGWLQLTDARSKLAELEEEYRRLEEECEKLRSTAAQRVTLKWASGTWPAREVDATGDGVPDFVIDICPWNLKSGKGKYEMTYDPVTRTVATVVDFQDLEPHDWNTWVIGYPEVYIGRKPWGSRYVNGFGVNFPMRVGELEPFLISFYFSFEELNLAGYNFAADAWLLKERDSVRGPGAGELEIMVWLVGVNAPGETVGAERVPIVINGSFAKALFEVKLVPQEDRADILIFLLREPEYRRGYVAYDPTMFVRLAVKYARFDVNGHYLIGWELGTEWVAHRRAPASGPAWGKAAWVLKDFQIIPRATLVENPRSP